MHNYLLGIATLYYTLKSGIRKGTNKEYVDSVDIVRIVRIVIIIWSIQPTYS
jgi:hypothetical protein